MKRLCELLSLLLALLMLASCAPKDSPKKAQGYAFTDSTGHEVVLPGQPTRVAVLFSSLADIWQLAGGKVTITVGESVERGICGTDALLVDNGAGKTVDTEALIAAAPDFAIVSADIPAQVEAAALLRTAGIPVAELRVESFTDYLSVLKICTDITQRPELYSEYGTAQQARIETALAVQPYAGKKVLFIRAGSSARSVKAKGSADHFAAAMLKELGAINIADGAPLLLDGLSMEVILREDPDYIFFVSMGDEEASRTYVMQMLQGEDWAALSAVKSEASYFLPKSMFHYKPSRNWADCYEQLLGKAQ